MGNVFFQFMDAISYIGLDGLCKEVWDIHWKGLFSTFLAFLRFMVFLDD